MLNSELNVPYVTSKKNHENKGLLLKNWKIIRLSVLLLKKGS